MQSPFAGRHIRYCITLPLAPSAMLYAHPYEVFHREKPGNWLFFEVSSLGEGSEAESSATAVRGGADDSGQLTLCFLTAKWRSGRSPGAASPPSAGASRRSEEPRRSRICPPRRRSVGRSVCLPPPLCLSPRGRSLRCGRPSAR